MKLTEFILNQLKTVIIGSLLLFLNSCDFFTETLAEYNGEKLKESEFEIYLESFPEEVNEDSLQLVFIEEWLSFQIVKNIVLKENQAEFYKNKIKANKYLHERNLFTLENSYIDNKLDTVVSRKQIMEHYQKNRENYVKKSFIVKALYMKIADTLSLKEDLEVAFMLKNDNDREIINKYANIYGRSFYWSEDSWIFLEDLTREIPISNDEKEKLVLDRGEGIFKDENYIYLLNILDYKMKESNSPLTYEEKEIKQHVLKRRIKELRSEAKKEIKKEIENELEK